MYFDRKHSKLSIIYYNALVWACFIKLHHTLGFGILLIHQILAIDTVDRFTRRLFMLYLLNDTLQEMLKRRAVAIGILNSGIVESSPDISGAKAVMHLTTGVSLSFQNHAVLPVLQVD